MVKRKISNLVVTTSMILGLSLFSNSAFAAEKSPEPKKFDIVKAKHDLANKYANHFKVNLSKDELDTRTKMVQYKLSKLASSEITQEELKAELRKDEIYLLEVPDSTPKTITILSSQGSDITMNAPWITYDSVTKRWDVTGGGYWKNTHWFNDITNAWVGYVGETKNVGGYDSVGVTYYNTSGTYNTSVLSSYGTWNDGNGWSSSTSNPSHGNGKYGVAFDYQDKIKLVDILGLIGPEDATYLGHGFSAGVQYDSNFANYNGKARTFYVHTWSNASISSITLGVSGKTFGADIQITNSANSFTIYNGSDASF
ncbi:hypothetical protein [Bacillus sp. UNCCL81]|uniref:hypothetical protein n=1 Tax=Bacillus sp. UNCCL81 TaxID=1502755 RepID=UPI0008EF142D|nr:hypothetical protein [Bacillus sp. UNCCL81]SFD59624.1 hypothetical protein SAMN02799633_04213 [Bacillus sp. UNCCL81]